MKDYLPLVKRPSRYTGGEVNSVRKALGPDSGVEFTMALAFPDVYEIGVSHLGLQILYQILNARDDVAAERVYAPWRDYEELLRKHNEPLRTLENNRALSQFDMVGFTLQYELSYTNILNMLDLGGITLMASERDDGAPIVIGGGPTAFNAEPMADFFDLFLLGEGEEAIEEIADVMIKAKNEDAPRADIIRRLSKIKGIYVPAFFEPIYNKDGTIKEIKMLVEPYKRVKKRIVLDLKTLPRPVRPVVPFVEAIHDRLSVEIARGCTRGCRFCHAGMVTRPAREREPADILKIIEQGIENTGYDEVSLLSLSTGDYCSIEPLMSALMKRFEDQRIAVSLPSLRVGTLGEGLISEIQKVKKTGFTLAPEAGTERLRGVINKGIKEEDLIETAGKVFAFGWRSIKLYFMIGLPTETMADIDGIVNVSARVRDTKGAGQGGYKRKKGNRGVRGQSPVSVSVGIFVPKPFTPFQWVPQISAEQSRMKQSYLKDKVRSAGMRLKWSDVEMSMLEGVFSRGDRRLAKVVLRAFNKGARFDGWSDEFKAGLWQESFEECSVDTAFYTTRERPSDEVFPWDHLDAGLDAGFLYDEYLKSRRGEPCPDCKVDRCTNCGVCDHKKVKNIVFHGDALALDNAPTITQTNEDVCRLRVNFTKEGRAVFLSHLEMKESIFRSIIRAGLPVRYSAGFHPMQKVSFNDPCPVGMESLDEYMDIDLTRAVKSTDVGEALSATLAPGLKIKSVTQISLQLPSISASIRGSKYLILIKNAPFRLEDADIEFDNLESLLQGFKGQEVINVRIRRSEKLRVIDIKPFLAELSLTANRDINLVLNNFDGPRVKPHELLSQLFGMPPELTLLIPVSKIRAVL